MPEINSLKRNTRMRNYLRWAAPEAVRPRDAAGWQVAALCQAYNFPTSAPGGGVIGILELGGGWNQSDLDQFSADNGFPPIQVQDISIDGVGRNTPGQDSNSDIEVALDIQVAAAAYFYSTGSINALRKCLDGVLGPEDFDRRHAVAAGCDVLSISWGSDENSWESAPNLAQAVDDAAAAANQSGMIIFAASGDNSSGDGDPGANVDLPSACPHIIGCGGTTKTTNSEVVWGDGTTNGSGTGGGYSDIFPPPVWQGTAPPRQTPGPGGRMVPDVAANADPNTGYMIVVNRAEMQIGGTSAVAPLYAGLFASFGQKIGANAAQVIWQNPQAFFDIITGSNGGYSAGPGPDPCTGIGAPNGALLASLFVRGLSGGGQTNIKRAAMAAAGSTDAICSSYKILKPILLAVEETPLLSSLKPEIDLFLQVMDRICRDSKNVSSLSPGDQLSPAARQQMLGKQVDEAIASHLLKRPVGVRAMNLGDSAKQLCAAYATIRPILDGLKGFLPATWAFGIGLAEEILDKLCKGLPVNSSIKQRS